MPDALYSSPAEPVAYLQLDLQYEPQPTDRVRQSWAMTFSRQRRISVCAKRILARVMEQICEDDMQLRAYYQLRAAAVVESTSLSPVTAFTFVHEALYELASVKWEFEDLAGGEWYVRHLLDTTQERRVGIKDGIITLILNPQLAPYFVQIAGQYSTYKLTDYMGLHSWYSMRFFEILSAFRDTGWWEVSLEEYRTFMDCAGELDKYGRPKTDKAGQPVRKHANTKDLIRKTVLTAQQELAHTPCAFDYTPLYAPNQGQRGRPRIVGLRFDLRQGRPATLPAAWLADAAAGPVISQLRAFRVSDHHLALYLKALGLPAARKLVREWQLKENGPQRIDDKARYCNAVFGRAGRLALAQQRAEVLQARQQLPPGLFGPALA